MPCHAVRRLLSSAVMLWLVSTLVFIVVHVAPAGAERVIAGPRATTETLERVRADLGLDRPAIVQYGDWLARLARGDLGDSHIHGTPVWSLVLERLPTTLWLVLGAGVIWFLGGVAAGVHAAVRARGVGDRMVTALVLFGLSTPPFVMALVLLYLLATKPGEAGILLFEPGPPAQEHFLRRMALPWIALALLMVATYTRLTRGAMLDALGEDYIRTARAKGLSERRVVYRHGLRAALTPVVTQFGVDLGALVGATIVIEKVFGLQGVGQLVHRSIALGDTPVIIGVTLLVTFFVVLANLAVDLGYPLLDPRLRPS